MLSMAVVVSTFAFSIPTASAKGESPFIDCEEIFIDMRSFTGWTSKSASFRVFTFYNDSDNPNWCHEYEGNFDNDGWYEGSNVLAKGIVPVKFCDNVYSFRIPSTKISHLRVVRTNSDGTEKWNLSPMMWDNQRSKYEAGNSGKYYSKQNCIKITGWDSAEWSQFRPSKNSSYSNLTANPDTSITGNSNLFTIDATFYDYYNDDEIQNGWGNIRQVTNHGNQRYSKDGNGYLENAYWEPFQYLNSKIAAHDSNVVYPLYFGNFFDKEDGYKGEGSSEMKNFSNWVNNSARLGGTHKSVVGLTGTDLDSDGDIVYAVNGGGNSKVKLPIFDKNWLDANNVGSVVNTKFPMRKVTENGVTGYYFDTSSNAANGGDNVWFNSDKSKFYYGAGTANGAKDSLKWYNSDGSDSGYGFFPFDSTRGTNAKAYDYGFGMRVDVKFNIGVDGKNNGIAEKFNFTGDDDVWVYIDGKLVLDLGGAHQKAKGEINFAGGTNRGTVTVDTQYNTLNSASRNQSFTIDNQDPTKEHTLTMFYVERGMVESNLSFNFNFVPVGNEYIVDKTVNTEPVNEGLKSAVAAADTFTFNQPTANGKVSSKGTISNNQFTLTNGESIKFNDQFTVPTTMTVTEGESSPLDYTTSWKAIDLEAKKKGAENYTIESSTGNQKQAVFNYKTLQDGSFAMTRVQLSYVNTPKVAPVTITKYVVQSDDSTSTSQGDTISDGSGDVEVDPDTTDFDGTVYVSLDGGTTWSNNYQLEYSVTGVQGTFRLTNGGKLAEGAKLRDTRILTFEKIPQGAKVKFIEDPTPQGYSFQSNSAPDGVTVGENGASIDITNNKLSGAAAITASKKLDSNLYSGSMFKFDLVGLPPIGGSISTEDYSETLNTISNGEVKYEISYNTPGTYRYVLREQGINTGNTQVDGEISIASAKRVFLVSVVMDANMNPTVTYYSYNAPAPQKNLLNNQYEEQAYTITENDFSDGKKITGNPVFENTVINPTVKIQKKDQNDALVTTAAAKFALYKVDSENGALLESNRLEESQTVNGEAVFTTNLSLYTGEYWKASTASDLQYQWYAIKETQAPSGHTPSSEVHYFKFPTSGSYTYTYGFINGKIVNPKTAGEGNTLIKVVGWCVTGVSMLALAAYLVITSRKRKISAKHNK